MADGVGNQAKLLSPFALKSLMHVLLSEERRLSERKQACSQVAGGFVPPHPQDLAL